MLLETLKKLELLLHDPSVRSNAERMGRLLHSSFREFGRSGATYMREDILAHIADVGQQPAIWAQDFHLEVLSDDLALLTYRSGHLGEDGKLQRHTNRASLWQRTELGWEMRFHQGTATEPFEKHAT